MTSTEPFKLTRLEASSPTSRKRMGTSRAGRGGVGGDEVTPEEDAVEAVRLLDDDDLEPRDGKRGGFGVGHHRTGGRRAERGEHEHGERDESGHAQT